jgi:tetratricopeptide (TPR) repeat protein
MSACGAATLPAAAVEVPASPPKADGANPVEVFENHGDLVLRDGDQQQRLLVPSQMRSHSRFIIRAKRATDATTARDAAVAAGSSTENKVAARRIMYQANQAFFKGEIEKTWELIEQAEKLDPEFYRIKSMKGSLLFKIGSKDLAVELWRESLTKNPNQPEIRAMLENAEKQL